MCAVALQACTVVLQDPIGSSFVEPIGEVDLRLTVVRRARSVQVRSDNHHMCLILLIRMHWHVHRHVHWHVHWRS